MSADISDQARRKKLSTPKEQEKLFAIWKSMGMKLIEDKTADLEYYMGK